QAVQPVAGGQCLCQRRVGRPVIPGELRGRWQGPALSVGQRATVREVVRQRCHGRPATPSASGRVNAPAYSALPTIAPSTPSSVSSRNARRSSRLDTPPEAITGASVAAHTCRRRSVFGPRIVPSLVTSVTTYREQPSASRRASTSHRSPPSLVQPRAARV